MVKCDACGQLTKSIMFRPLDGLGRCGPCRANDIPYGTYLKENPEEPPKTNEVTELRRDLTAAHRHIEHLQEVLFDACEKALDPDEHYDLQDIARALKPGLVLFEPETLESAAVPTDNTPAESTSKLISYALALMVMLPEGLKHTKEYENLAREISAMSPSFHPLK